MNALKGVIDWWFETGQEGVCWVFYEDGKTGWDAFKMVEKGDRLKVCDENGKVVFDGEIIPDYKKGWKRHYRNAKHGQPTALGFWIHWTQKGWKPDDWARLFLRELEDEKPLRAELTKHE